MRHPVLQQSLAVGLIAARTLMAAVLPLAAAERLRIGATLHPYYSWAANVVGDAADVVPVIPGEGDPTPISRGRRTWCPCRTWMRW
jgi:zinc transport system substrate-binding protein